MRHKMVNLCPDSLEIASKMKNFSKWVRDELLKIKAVQDEIAEQILWYRCPSCWKVFKEQAGTQTCLNTDCGFIGSLELL